MKIDVRHNFQDVLRKLTDIQNRQVPFATMLALNETAFQIKREVEREMPKRLDRPTPWTLRSVRYTKAKKDRLFAEVWFDPWGNKRAITAERWLGPHIFGAARGAKGFERRLRNAGILGSDEFVVPGAEAPIDRYGNVPGSFIVKLLSRLQAAEQVSGYSANETASSRKRRKSRNTRQVEYFVARPGSHLAPGIWSRTYFGFGTAVKPIFLFVKQPRYRKRFPFFEIGQRVRAVEFPRRFDAAMQRALATAR